MRVSPLTFLLLQILGLVITVAWWALVAIGALFLVKWVLL